MYNFALHTCVGVSNNGYKFLRYTVMPHQQEKFTQVERRAAETGLVSTPRRLKF
jgi:hypothetical protein